MLSLSRFFAFFTLTAVAGALGSSPPPPCPPPSACSPPAAGNRFFFFLEALAAPPAAVCPASRSNFRDFLEGDSAGLLLLSPSPLRSPEPASARLFFAETPTACFDRGVLTAGGRFRLVYSVKERGVSAYVGSLVELHTQLIKRETMRKTSETAYLEHLHETLLCHRNFHI